MRWIKHASIRQLLTGITIKQKWQFNERRSRQCHGSQSFKNSSEANHEQPIQITLQHVREQESVISLGRREGTDGLR